MQIFLKISDNINFRISQAKALQPKFPFTMGSLVNILSMKMQEILHTPRRLSSSWRPLSLSSSSFPKKENMEKFASCFFFGWIANLFTKRFYLCAPCDVYRDATDDIVILWLVVGDAWAFHVTTRLFSDQIFGAESTIFFF